MSGTKEDQVQARIAALLNAPRHVQASALWSLALGAAALLRFLAMANAGRLSFGKAPLFGVLMLGWFWFCGYSLYDRSKWGFVAVIGMAVLPILGILALSVHLFRLVVEGTLTVSWPDTIHSVVGVVQLMVTCILLRHLLSREVREHVFKPAE